MRILSENELAFVTGAEGVIISPPVIDEPVIEEPVPGERKGNNGFGNGGDDGVPGRSDFQDVTR